MPSAGSAARAGSSAAPGRSSCRSRRRPRPRARAAPECPSAMKRAGLDRRAGACGPRTNGFVPRPGDRRARSRAGRRSADTWTRATPPLHRAPAPRPAGSPSNSGGVFWCVQRTSPVSSAATASSATSRPPPSAVAAELDDRRGEQHAEERQREDQVACLGRRRRVERREHERDGRHGDDAREQHDALGPAAPEQDRAGQRKQEDRCRPGVMARAEVAGDPPEVMQHRGRGTQSRPAAADADVEAVAQDEVGPPERDPDDAHRGRASRSLRADAGGGAGRRAPVRRRRAPRTDDWRASASRATPQSANRRRPPRSSAERSARNESRLVKRNRLYIRP